jgi:DNA-binding MarR family transcriptional regulator
MGRRMTSTDSDDLIEAERTVRHRLAHSDPPLDVDYEATAVVANVFRIASAARAHIERTALATDNLSFTAFTVLWVLWIWGEDEFRHVAAESGITKGTLTGVLTTLERRGLAVRRRHHSDRRLVMVAATPAGTALMERLFPRVNAQETRIVGRLSDDETRSLAHLLRELLRQLDSLDPNSSPN